MSKMTKVFIIIGAALIVLIAAGLGIFFYFRSEITPMDGAGMKAYESYPKLQGNYTEVGLSGMYTPEKCSIEDGVFCYTEENEEKHVSVFFTSGAEYSVQAVDPVTISFSEGEGPWYGNLLYHTQEMDGHEVRILTSFIFEDDGRGLIVMNEFVHDDDLQYISSAFRSDIRRDLNGQ